ncbi:Rhodanese-like domain-containing protein [Peptoclostridium litorale DSM 5388]|uniref:Rhodanese domain-containing protein n=1 Tax=Peptoclostridium litorale DSM 5388 TaxID=1121324 RepID=A0A069RFZ4_PEPLI|nr:rhodanese-like domain-containing protein [Peptoclostridium litorale]KDR95964.1 hypothetical protein CLIT_8c01330 [Peptoclostridium litorale DSM 5388]SIO09082.1 Rhodanese-like domain-containing protein [Peptoclostridium litorale DSM 5388]
MKFLEREFITSSELFTMISSKKDCKILDMRSKSEFEDYHICNAIHVSRQEIESKIAQIQNEGPMPIIIVSDFESDSIEILALVDNKDRVFYLKRGMNEGWFELLKHIRANELK